jgi:hypothetical protein
MVISFSTGGGGVGVTTGLVVLTPVLFVLLIADFEDLQELKPSVSPSKIRMLYLYIVISGTALTDPLKNV